MNSLIFDTDVYCKEEKCAELTKVIFDPEKRQVTDLVVEKGVLIKKRRIVPISVVKFAEKNRVNLTASEEELQDFHEYKETYIEEIPADRRLDEAAAQGTPYGLATGLPPVPTIKEHFIEGVADHLAPMDKDTPVKAADSTVGQVYGLIVDSENHTIQEILVHRGTIFVEEFLISTEIVERMSSEGVFLNIEKSELDDLIEYDEEWDRYWDRMPKSSTI